MKPDIHPDYHEIEVAFPDGSSFKTHSTYGKKNAKLQLEVDYKNHPAWTGSGRVMNKSAGGVAKFNEKFGSIFGGATAKETPTTQTAKEDAKASNTDNITPTEEPTDSEK